MLPDHRFKMFLLQTAAANITLADVLYILGVITTLGGLFVGFAKVVTRMSILQSTVDQQGATIISLQSDIKEMAKDLKRFEIEMARK